MPDDDHRVIVDFYREVGTAAVADLIRARRGQLVLHSAPQAAIEGPTVVQSAVQTPVDEPLWQTRWATATPIPQPELPLTWWERVDKLALALKVAGVLAALGLAVCVVWLIVVTLKALAAALASVVSTLVGVVGIIAVIALIAFLASLGGGGKRFSGTFQGKMH